MDDIVLNFAAPAPGVAVPSARRSKSAMSGNWTQVRKEKRRVKIQAKKAERALQTTENAAKAATGADRPAKSLGKPKLDKGKGRADIKDFDDVLELGEVPKKQRKAPAALTRPQVISSLFSAEPLPSAPTAPAGPSVIHAPSNAAISSLSVASTSLGLHPSLAVHLQSDRMGAIANPTGVQALAWPRLLANDERRDVVIQSQTGSGKTLAYLVPIVQDLLRLEGTKSRDLGTFAVVLVPTRELAEQVADVATKLLRLEGKATEDESAGLGRTQWLVVSTLHGGTNRSHEKARLRKGVPLLICTPGRLLDHLEKTSCLRFAGDPPLPPTDPDADLKPLRKSDAKLSLRWLVLDEADRLMDMGFEEQMRGILRHLDDREKKARSFWKIKAVSSLADRMERRTVLCSATMPTKVEQLVGTALRDPVTLKGATDAEAGGDAEDGTKADAFEAPAQLNQHHVVMPPKLRLVSLVALLRRLFVGKNAGGSKALVFLSCTDAVDFVFEALGGLAMGRDGAPPADDGDDEDADERRKISRTCALLPGVQLFHLHGSLELSLRLASLKAFSVADDSSPSVLFCTSLASRGLDVPFVSHVVQYDLPTEGGVNEYLHRVGRTARAGKAGEAWSFLLPSEEGWVEESRQDLKQTGVEELLKQGFGGKARDWETRATDVQMAVERWVIGDQRNASLARRAFSSHVRAYATHPSDEKRFFHVKNLHLGHLAKTFGLREAPVNVGVSGAGVGGGKKRKAQGDGFEVLEQRKKVHTLRGPAGNTADEFNLGGADLEALVSRRH